MCLIKSYAGQWRITLFMLNTVWTEWANSNVKRLSQIARCLYFKGRHSTPKFGICCSICKRHVNFTAIFGRKKRLFLYERPINVHFYLYKPLYQLTSATVPFIYKMYSSFINNLGNGMFSAVKWLQKIQ